MIGFFSPYLPRRAVPDASGPAAATTGRFEVPDAVFRGALADNPAIDPYLAFPLSCSRTASSLLRPESQITVQHQRCGIRIDWGCFDRMPGLRGGPRRHLAATQAAGEKQAKVKGTVRCRPRKAS
jgi:hypothetical protein